MTDLVTSPTSVHYVSEIRLRLALMEAHEAASRLQHLAATLAGRYPDLSASISSLAGAVADDAANYLAGRTATVPKPG